MLTTESKTIRVKMVINGKLYQLWVNKETEAVTDIRSEDNPFKTPYLKVGIKKFIEVAKAYESDGKLEHPENTGF
jgi:hypothetical protein